MTVIHQAELDDPRNDAFPNIETSLQQSQAYGDREKDLKDSLARNPYDIDLNVQLAQLYEAEEKYPQVNDTLRTVAGLTNWSDQTMGPIIQYYVDEAHNFNAAIAFIEARTRVDAKDPKLFFELAALHAVQDENDDAIKNLGQAIALDPTNVPMAAKVDPRFGALHDDPRFQALVSTPPTNAPPVNSVAPVPPKGKLKKPVNR